MLHYSIFSVYSVYLYLWHVADIGILLFGPILKNKFDCTMCMIDVDTEDYGPVLQFQKPQLCHNYVYVTIMPTMSQIS